MQTSFGINEIQNLQTLLMFQHTIGGFADRMIDCQQIPLSIEAKSMVHRFQPICISEFRLSYSHSIVAGGFEEIS